MAEEKSSKRNTASIADVATSIQVKTFTNWVNHHLSKGKENNLHISQLETDISSGVILARLLEKLSGRTIAKIVDNPKNKAFKLANVNLCLSFISEYLQIKLVGIGAQDIVDGNTTHILGIIWALIRKFAFSANGAPLSKERLLGFCIEKTSGYSNVNVINFDSSFRDGLAIAALVHKYDPSLIDISKMTPQTALENLDTAFSVAETALGIPHLLDAQDMIVAGEDAIMTLITEFYHLYRHRDAPLRLSTSASVNSMSDLRTVSGSSENMASSIENEKLKQENQSLQEQLSQLRLLSESQDKNLDSARDDIAKLRAKKKVQKVQFGNEITDLKKANEELEVKVKELTAITVDLAPQQYQARIKELEEGEAKSKESADKYKKKNKKLKGQLDIANNSIKTKEERISALDQKVVLLLEEVTILKEQIEVYKRAKPIEAVKPAVSETKIEAPILVESIELKDSKDSLSSDMGSSAELVVKEEDSKNEKKKKKEKEKRKSSIRIKSLRKKSDSLTALGIELSQVKQDLEELQRDMEVDSGIRRSRGSMSAQSRRAEIVKELLTTERTYVNSLRTVVDVYLKPLRQADYIEKQDIKAIFSEIEVILNYNVMILGQIEARASNWTDDQRIGDIFLKTIEFMKVYTQYVNNYNRALTVVHKLSSQNPKFAQFLQTCIDDPRCHHLNIYQFLIMPIQRIPRYVLLLEGLAENTDAAHADYESVKTALTKVKEVAGYVNEKKREAENISEVLKIQDKVTGEFENLAKPHRRYIREGELYAELENLPRKNYYIFLFNDMILVTKKMTGVFGTGTPMYKYLAEIELAHNTQIIPANKKAAKASFALMSKGIVYNFVADAPDDQTAWVDALNDVCKKLAVTLRKGEYV